MFLILFFLFAKQPTTLPKWELGLGYFYADLQDYPGSNESTVRSFPIPYFIYRGDIVQADREGGIRTRFLKETYYELDFSFSGSFPANSDDNLAREGMPDLDWMFEIGPQLKVFLYSNDDMDLLFRLPVRWIASTEFSKIEERGFGMNPSLRFSWKRLGLPGLRFNTTYTQDYASRDVQGYFYDVPQTFVTADRSLFKAKEGLLGESMDFSLIYFRGPFAVFANFGFNSFKNSPNRDSDLHTADSTRSFVIGFVYSMYQSQEMQK